MPVSGAEEDRKRAQRAEQVALFRYQLIREAADPGCCRTLKMSVAASLPVSVCMM